MKKIIILLLMLFTLTGCSVEYNLTITEEYIYENIDLISETLEESNDINDYIKPVEAFINSPMHSESNEKLPGVEYYNLSKTNNNGLNNMQLNYDYKFDDYKNGNIINYSVSVLKIEKEDNIYSFNTGATLKVFTNYQALNNLVVKITLDEEFELVNTNADTINNNEYIWNVDRNNYKTNPISLSFQKIDDEDNDDIGNGNNNDNDNEIENDKDDYNNQNNQNNNQDKQNEANNIFLILGLFIVYIVILITIIVFSKKIRK